MIEPKQELHWSLQEGLLEAGILEELASKKHSSSLVGPYLLLKQTPSPSLNGRGAFD